ncbi:MAG: hypothetical protein R3C42_06075 [Parvularculaceae bacterium]
MIPAPNRRADALPQRRPVAVNASGIIRHEQPGRIGAERDDEAAATAAIAMSDAPSRESVE